MRNEPDWLMQARARGLEIREQGVNPEPFALLTGQHALGSDVPTMTEAEFQGHVIELAQACGWTVAHCRAVRVATVKSGGEIEYHWETPLSADGKGFPDLLMLRNGRQVVTELKVGSNRPTREQLGWLAGFLLVPGCTGGVYYPRDWTEIVLLLKPDAEPLRG